MWRSAFVFYIATQLSQFVFVFFHASVWPNCRRSPRQILLSDLSTLHHQCKRQTLILLRLDRSFCLVLWSNCHQWMVLSACLPQIHHHPCNCIKISTRLVLRRTLGIPSKLLCYPVLSEAAGWGTPAIYARTPHISGLPPPRAPTTLIDHSLLPQSIPRCISALTCTLSALHISVTWKDFCGW